tara:strand:+ start:13954 stop:14949 length:996 start_codon:yes stop_codon:yes gene_type:complete
MKKYSILEIFTMLIVGCKKYNFVFFLFACFSISSFSFSQQLPLHNQYIYNPLVINPSFAGVSSLSSINLTTRSQWIGFSDGITTLSLSGNYPISENQGVGGTLFQDNTGAISITGLEIDYSFKFPLILDYSLSLGLGLVPYQYLYDANQVNPNSPQPFDPALDISDKSTSFDMNFGMFVYSDFMFAGFSVLNLIQSSTIPNVSSNNDVPNQLVRHYYALAGYHYFNEASRVGLEQSILMRSTTYSGVQFDFNFKAEFNDSFYLLCGYRTNQEILAGFGIKYGKIGFVYNIDINYGEIGEYSNSSHEIGLIFYLNNNRNIFNWTRDLNLQYK